MKEAIGYLRVSTREQGRSGLLGPPVNISLIDYKSHTTAIRRARGVSMRMLGVATLTAILTGCLTVGLDVVPVEKDTYPLLESSQCNVCASMARALLRIAAENRRGESIQVRRFSGGLSTTRCCAAAASA